MKFSLDGLKSAWNEKENPQVIYEGLVEKRLKVEREIEMTPKNKTTELKYLEAQWNFLSAAINGIKHKHPEIREAVDTISLMKYFFHEAKHFLSRQTFETIKDRATVRLTQKLNQGKKFYKSPSKKDSE